MSLADELLNDLDGLSDDAGLSETEEQPVAGPSTSMGPPPVPSRKRAAEDDDNDDEDEEMAAEGAGLVSEGAKLADGTSAVGFVGVGGVRPADELDREEVEGMNLKVVEDVETVVKLHKSKKLTQALEVCASCGMIRLV
jgi:U4/U6 small nuclear ribonucleoprotein PRP31